MSAWRIFNFLCRMQCYIDQPYVQQSPRNVLLYISWTSTYFFMWNIPQQRVLHNMKTFDELASITNLYIFVNIQTLDIILSQTSTMLNNLKFFGKYIWLSLLPVIFPRYILYADVVTPLSRNLPGAFMALLWSSAWRRLIKPISRVLCKLSVL